MRLFCFLQHFGAAEVLKITIWKTQKKRLAVYRKLDQAMTQRKDSSKNVLQVLVPG